MQYDFPVVSAPELDALAQELRASIAVNGEGGGGRKGGGGEGGAYGPGRGAECYPYPITAQLVAAVVEGACKPPPGAGAGPSVSSIGATADADAADESKGGVGDGAGDNAGAGVVRCAFQRLCAAVLVHFACYVVQLSDADADAALAQYRCHVEVAPPEAEVANPADASGDEYDDTVLAAAAAAATSSVRPDETENDGRDGDGRDRDGDVSDSDSDWEPLEANPMVGPGGGGGGGWLSDDGDSPLARMDAGDRVDFKLSDLLGRARYACFDAVEVAP